MVNGEQHILTIHYSKWCQACGGVSSTVDGKFHKRKSCYPRHGTIRHQMDMQQLLNSAMLPFYLAIRLVMLGRYCTQLGPKDRPQFLPEEGGEMWIPVMDDVSRDPKGMDHMIKEQLSLTSSATCRLAKHT